MKIEHITYDNAHGRTAVRPSNTQKLRNYINSKRTKPEAGDDTNKLLSKVGRPNSAPSERCNKPMSEEDICAFLNLGPAGFRASYGELNARSNNWNPTVRNKVTFSDDAKLPRHQELGEKVKYVVPGSAVEYLARRRAGRAALQEGGSSKDELPAAAGLRTSPRVQNRSLINPTSSKATARPHERTTSNITSYLTISADLLDSTRREITSSVRKSAEKVVSSKFTSPFHLDHRQRQALIDDASDSDESFFCVGENKGQPSTPLADLERKRRLSGTGTSPWLTGVEASSAGICRLCRQRLVQADKRLCDICTHEIRPLNLQPRKAQPLKRNPIIQEVKPTPPLKDMKQVKTIASVRPRLPHIACMVSRTPPPNVGAARNLKIESVSLKTNVVGQAPHYPSPQHADVETVAPFKEAPVARCEQWQTEDIRAEYAKTKEMFDRWSGSWEDEYVTSPGDSPILGSFQTETQASSKNQREDEVAMLPQGILQGRKRIKRNSSFYAFWNDLLGQEI